LAPCILDHRSATGAPSGQLLAPLESATALDTSGTGAKVGSRKGSIDKTVSIPTARPETRQLKPTLHRTLRLFIL
tara:strand:- start:297 stop:521 length:225 start_codon:yes stop_codon:yes gene_type:complete